MFKISLFATSGCYIFTSSARSDSYHLSIEDDMGNFLVCVHFPYVNRTLNTFVILIPFVASTRGYILPIRANSDGVDVTFIIFSAGWARSIIVVQQEIGAIACWKYGHGLYGRQTSNHLVRISCGIYQLRLSRQLSCKGNLS